jgi:hypothetical protein
MALIGNLNLKAVSLPARPSSLAARWPGTSPRTRRACGMPLPPGDDHRGVPQGGAFTRCTLAPRSRAWDAWACLIQWGETSPLYAYLPRRCPDDPLGLPGYDRSLRPVLAPLAGSEERGVGGSDQRWVEPLYRVLGDWPSSVLSKASIGSPKDLHDLGDGKGRRGLKAAQNGSSSVSSSVSGGAPVREWEAAAKE